MHGLTDTHDTSPTPSPPSEENFLDPDVPIQNEGDTDPTLDLSHQLSASLNLPRTPTPPFPTTRPSHNVFFPPNPPPTTMSSTKSTELHLGTPEYFDGSFDKSRSWMNTVQFYLVVNKAVYNTDEKKIAFTLSYMTKGSALTWATTFCTNCISGTTISFGSFADFVTAFETSFKQQDVTGTAVAWLTMTCMTKK